MTACFFIANIRFVENHALADPSGDERASLAEALAVIRNYRTLDAPRPPRDTLAPIVGNGPASPYTGAVAYALQLSDLMRAFRAAPRFCRRGLHEMTPDNTYHGKKSDQCRACRNLSRRSRDYELSIVA